MWYICIKGRTSWKEGLLNVLRVLEMFKTQSSVSDSELVGKKVTTGMEVENI